MNMTEEDMVRDMMNDFDDMFNGGNGTNDMMNNMTMGNRTTGHNVTTDDMNYMGNIYIIASDMCTS